MKIYIPTYKRPNTQITYNALPDKYKDNVVMVVQRQEESLYREKYDCGFMIVDDDIGLTKTRTQIFEKNRGKFRIFGAQCDDDLIDNYSFQVDGYNFLEPRFYFSRKHKDKQQRDIDDWDGINTFFELKVNECYPFNHISSEQFGVQYL